MKKIKSIIFYLGEVLLNTSCQNTINEFKKLGIKTLLVVLLIDDPHKHVESNKKLGGQQFHLKKKRNYN